jgi:TonB-dependent receptor
MKLKKAIWLVSVASAALGFNAASAIAQEAPAQEAQPQEAAAGPAVEGEDQAARVVVTGRRPLAESEAAALEIQREADSVVSVLAADAIGNLPDQNIAFAIGRLPGVGIERDQGQARYVNLRGTPNYWTTLSFDGVPIVSPEGRSTRFDNIPSALANQVIVTKAITPNMPGDTVAGNVNIVTRSGFDHDDLYINGKLGVGLVTLGGGEEVDSNIVMSNQFLNGKLAILGQATYYRRNMVTDNWETDPYLAARDGGGILFAREHENKNYRLTRENQSLSLRADYRLTDESTVFWNNVWTNYTDEELRSNYIFRLDQGTAANGAAYSTVASGNTGLLGTSYGARINQNTNSLESEEDIYSSTLGGDHDDMFGWDFDWRANFTYTADGSDAPALPNWQSPSAFGSRPTVAYDFRDEKNHRIDLFRTGGTTTARTRGVHANSVEDFPIEFQNIQRAVGGAETQAWTLKGDAAHDFTLGGIDVEFSTGLFYTDRSKTQKTKSWTATRAQLVAAGVPVPEITAAGPTAAYNALFLNKEYLGKDQVAYDFRYHSKTALEAFALDMQSRGIATRNFAADTANYYNVTEEILAGYAMGKVDFDWGNIVAGARVEQFKNTGESFVPFGSTSRIVNSEGEDTLVYPSAQINWDMTDEMKLRIGLTTSASRPDFDNLRPNFTFDDTAQTISGGNPDATPEKQAGIDVYYEWYMQPEGFLSAGVFYKDITDVLYSQTLPSFGSDILNSNGVNRSDYDFSTIANGGDGYLQGFEVFYSQTAQGLVDAIGAPDWLGGFGLRASATWVDSEVQLGSFKTTLPGTSDGVYNLQATYEKYGLSVRFAYQFRTAWIQGVSGQSLTYWDDDEEIDLSVRYQVSDQVEWFFDAVNLGNESAIRYIDNPIYPIEHETFGQRYITGVRFNF